MKITAFHDSIKYTIDLGKAIDISIPLINGKTGPKCFYAPDFKVEPVISGDFVGSTLHGSPVNFKNIIINPHGNGTHTECIGHITTEAFTINQCLKEFHFFSRLLSIEPEIKENGDQVISAEQLKNIFDNIIDVEVLILRTLPNDESKRNKDYSGTNPPYFSSDAIYYLNQMGIKHLLTDLPSVDKEVDGGLLSSHKAFWGIPDHLYTEKTITELIYVDNKLTDGLYFCNIQIASIESDASPSKILLFEVYQS